MELNKIEDLIIKYNNAETSLKEEVQLKAFFAQETVPSHLEVYKPLFNYFNEVQTKETYNKSLPLKTKTTEWYKWFSAAAVILISAGLYFNHSFKSNDLGTFEEQQAELAYKEVVKSLEMVSKNLNKGTSSVEYLQVFNKGTAQVNYLNELQNPIGRVITINE